MYCFVSFQFCYQLMFPIDLICLPVVYAFFCSFICAIQMKVTSLDLSLSCPYRHGISSLFRCKNILKLVASLLYPTYLFPHTDICCMWCRHLNLIWESAGTLCTFMNHLYMEQALYMQTIKPVVEPQCCFSTSRLELRERSCTVLHKALFTKSSKNLYYVVLCSCFALLAVLCGLKLLHTAVTVRALN